MDAAIKPLTEVVDTVERLGTAVKDILFERELDAIAVVRRPVVHDGGELPERLANR